MRPTFNPETINLQPPRIKTMPNREQRLKTLLKVLLRESIVTAIKKRIRAHVAELRQSLTERPTVPILRSGEHAAWRAPLNPDPQTVREYFGGEEGIDTSYLILNG